MKKINYNHIMQCLRHYKNGAILLALIALLAISCKDSWLDVKPNKSYVTLSTLPDVQALLDNSPIMNGDQAGLTPNMGEISSDNYYLAYSDWQTCTPIERNCYIWAKQIFDGNTSLDWDEGYQAVYYANSALDALATIKADDSNQTSWNNVKGSALFYRAYNFYNMVEIFAKRYNTSTAASDLGIPLRLTSDPNAKSTRATVQQTYDQIFSDLTQAETLLPQTPLYKTRPSKAAVEALLARIYLSVGDYSNSLAHAGNALGMYNTLIDYNTLSKTATYPLARYNAEVIFQSVMNSSAIFKSKQKIDTNLYASYDANDLRKSVFFKIATTGSAFFKGSYNGSSNQFSGLAVDELYLISAECRARTNDISGAMSDLNIMLKNRYTSGTFVPLTATDQTDALDKVLKERRKELIFRGLRWTDLRRFNSNTATAITLTRNLNGTVYQLLPSSPEYTFPIPDDVIAANPSMPQNPR